MTTVPIKVNTAPEPDIRCVDGCGTTAMTEMEAQRAGWLAMQITRGYRCPKCGTQLSLANWRAEIK